MVPESGGPGVAWAQSTLGLMYRRGEGVPQDDAQAVQWYRKAADQGDASAQFNLGVMYEHSEGTVPRRCSGTGKRRTRGM